MTTVTLRPLRATDAPERVGAADPNNKSRAPSLRCGVLVGAHIARIKDDLHALGRWFIGERFHKLCLAKARSSALLANATHLLYATSPPR